MGEDPKSGQQLSVGKSHGTLQQHDSLPKLRSMGLQESGNLLSLGTHHKSSSKARAPELELGGRFKEMKGFRETQYSNRSEDEQERRRLAKKNGQLNIPASSTMIRKEKPKMKKGVFF